jgi:hypothetical protein
MEIILMTPVIDPVRVPNAYIHRVVSPWKPDYEDDQYQLGEVLAAEAYAICADENGSEVLKSTSENMMPLNKIMARIVEIIKLDHPLSNPA